MLPSLWLFGFNDEGKQLRLVAGGRLRARLAAQSVLRPPNYTLPFCLTVDASDLAVGDMLFQMVDGLEHSICFYSRKLDHHQKRYYAIEKEEFSVVLAVRYFSVYFGTGVCGCSRNGGHNSYLLGSY